ncbi:ADP-heptose:LPS heptosyltransferase (RfaF) (PDB:1PSW) [Commensalibacter communis]|uniref:autotransporter strand-loop-strand O-heptosyltransferase n=1 Tax=Commensalibacter communis TaxID=2972786 RepID=UPI0022FF8A3F|nr:autotransporter strand-loop-strand O-heptosyltransferase [Commensalibacter communis]CAI3960065.1 ADP-heptose:LPS heptosyltransferase (RfaF) (PDB:1PSW) [Commensalibacter communis]
MNNLSFSSQANSAFLVSSSDTPPISEQQELPPISIKNTQNAPYPLPAAELTQKDKSGISFDFNQGCRVKLPKPKKNTTWHLQMMDSNTGNILFEHNNLQETVVLSTKQWFVQFGIKVWSRSITSEDQQEKEELILDYIFNLDDQIILIQFPNGTLGDTLAWMSYAARFATKHSKSKVFCALSDLISPLFKKSYPNIHFVTHQEVIDQKLPQKAYATYNLGLFFDDKDCNLQPTDFRFVGLHKTAAYILGVSPEEEPAKIDFPDEGRPIEEPYVCIAVQASTQCKQWNNPTGWIEVIDYLKDKGYRVICIDKEAVGGQNINWNYMPFNAENQTGNHPLAERARWLKHAEFFIGTSSGLAWLAWSVGTPIVLISGFTHPTNEFYTPHRVINWHTCNSCWNDPKERFDHFDFLWCPRHKNTQRQFECTKLITAQLVINHINQLINT